MWRTGDLVAIKEIDAGNFRNISQIEQIQEEINVLSNLKHANIIHLLDSIFIGKMVYVIMEYVAGGSLMDFVTSQVGVLNGRSPAVIQASSTRLACRWFS